MKQLPIGFRGVKRQSHRERFQLWRILVTGSSLCHNVFLAPTKIKVIKVKHVEEED